MKTVLFIKITRTRVSRVSEKLYKYPFFENLYFVLYYTRQQRIPKLNFNYKIIQRSLQFSILKYFPFCSPRKLERCEIQNTATRNITIPYKGTEYFQIKDTPMCLRVLKQRFLVFSYVSSRHLYTTSYHVFVTSL